jgi:hypothetical protein
MPRRPREILLVVLFAALLPCAHAQAIVTFNFNDQSSPTATLTASTVASHLTVGTFSVSDNAFTSTNLTTGSPPDSPAVGDTGSWNASSPTKYFSFTVTPDAGYSLTITGISFDYRQTATGAANYQINIGANTNVASGSFSTDSAWHSVSSSLTLTALTNGTEVRIYGYNGGVGSFGIDRVTLNGSVTAVPEPATYATIAALCAFGFAAFRPKRKSASIA